MATSIDPKSLRVVDLKEELGKRNLSKTGKKDELVARLTEALAEETEAAAPAAEQGEPETAVPEAAPTAEAPPSTTATITEDVPVSEAIQETTTSTEQTIIPPTTDDTQQKSELVTTIEEQSQVNDVVESQTLDTNAPAETAIEETITTAAAPDSKPSEDSTIPSSATATISSPIKNDQAQPPITNESAVAAVPSPPPPTTDTDMKTADQPIVSKRKREGSVELEQDKRTKMESSQPTTTETKETTSSSSGSVQITDEHNAVCIKGFVRPLITKHLQEFIKQYGDVKRFWIDPIKTHCYIIYETLDQATNAFQSIDGTVYPPTNTGKQVTAIRLTSTQASQLMDREQQVADHHGRVNWEKLLEKVLNNEPIEEPAAAADHSPTTAKRRVGGLEQITRQLQQRGAVSAIMDQEQQKQPAPSILDRLSTSMDTKVPLPVPTTESQMTIAGISRMAEGKSLGDLFLKTKANPPLYYLPVDKDIAASRLEALKNKVD